MRRLGLLLLLALVFAAAAVLYIYSSPTAPPPAQTPTAAQSPPSTTATGQLIVPVKGVSPEQLVDTWGQSREGGARVHQAIDIIAPQGTPVVAAVAGTVEKLFQSARGGITAYVRSEDGRWTSYYAHLQRYAEGLAEGKRVGRGDPIGFVGDTGNAGAGNYHLHFALGRMRPGEKWYEGEPVNPYPILVGREPLR